MDVVKTRLQVFETKASAWTVAKELYKEAGWRGFTKGMVPRILWIAPGTAITMVACKSLIMTDILDEQIKRAFSLPS